MLEIIEDWFINLNIYGSMLLGFGRRNPKLVLIFGMITFCSVCAAHLYLYDSSRPAFSILSLISAAIALVLIYFYDNGEATGLEYEDHKVQPDSRLWLET